MFTSNDKQSMKMPE